MKLCLDTNAYANFKRGNTELSDLLEKADEIFLPAAVLGELYAGFFMGNKTKQNIAELTAFLDLPGVSFVSVTMPLCERYGHVIQMLQQQGTPIPTNDVWIAATTFETGARLVTYDKHFDHVPGLTIYSPNS